MYDKFPCFDKGITFMEKKERATEIFVKHLEQWESSPRRMESGYQY